MSSHGQGGSLEFQDPGEYNQRRRLKAIGDARHQAREMYTAVEAGISDFDTPQVAVFAAVKAYALELEWLIAKHGDEKYAHTELGEVVVPVPDELQAMADRHTQGGRLVGSADVDAYRLEVVGLLSAPSSPGVAFIDLPQEVHHEWTAHVDPRHEKPGHKTFRNSAAIPVDVSYAAMRLCNRFLEESGLDAKIEGEVDDDAPPA